MSETLFFDKTHEAKWAENWRRRNVNVDVVPLRFYERGSVEVREREIRRFGDLGYYERKTVTGDDTVWIIAHIPTGYQVGPEFTTKEDALMFVYLVRDLDWSFTKPDREYPDEFRRRVYEASVQAEACFVPPALSSSFHDSDECSSEEGA